MLGSNLLLSLWACEPGPAATVRLCRTVAATPGAPASDAAAAQLARAAMKVHRSNEHVLLAIARMCIAIGELDLAEEALRWAWANGWEDPKVVQMWGEICLHRQENDAARAAFALLASLRRRAGSEPPPDRPSGVYGREDERSHEVERPRS